MPRRPSRTVDTLQSTVFSSLVSKMKHVTAPTIPLHVGDTWREPPACVSEHLAEPSRRQYNYAPPHGEPVLLDAIAERLGRHGPAPERDALLVVSGATSGLSVVCQALLDPGDEVLMPSPFWPLIRGIVASRGATAVQVPFFTRTHDASFDPEAALEAAITPRTVAIYLSRVSNPTGVVLSDDAVAAVERVAVRRDLWVLSDDVYEELWLGDSPPAPLWTRPGLQDRTITMHSLSKAYGLAGARVGYAHGPVAMMRAIRDVNTFQVYCAPKPLQRAAARALREGDPWLAEARAQYSAAARETAGVFGIPVPEGGTFVFVDATPWLDGAPTALPFLERCMEAGVALTPGASCGQHFDRWFRLCFTSVPPAELSVALSRIRGILR